MAKNKTVSLDLLIEKMNLSLAGSSPESILYRRSITSFVESILHQRGRYRGFRYIGKAEAPQAWSFDYDKMAPNPDDDTRRVYF
jgi:hypothetical protein